MGRPIGVWIATAYLFAQFALITLYLYLFVSIEGGTILSLLKCAAAVLTMLLGVILLLALSRWAVLTIGLLAALQATSLLEYLTADSSTFIDTQGSDTILVPLVISAATITVFLYSAWLWRGGVLR